MSNTEVLALGAKNGIPGMNSGWFIVTEILLSIISILILVGIVKLLIRVIKKYDDKVENTNSNPFRKICKWFFIIVSIIFIYFVWFGNIHYYLHDHLELGVAFGVPIGISLSLGMRDWKSTLWLIITSGVVSVLVAFFAACFIPKGYYDIVMKIAVTVVWVLSSIKMLYSDGSYIA